MLSHGSEITLLPGLPGSPGKAEDRKEDIVSFIRKASSHVGLSTVLLILCVNRAAELALIFSHASSLSLSLSLSLRQHNELKSLANKENVYMFLVTWNKMTWQAIKCGRKSSPRQPVVI